jgi:hypothetical protein
VAWAEAETVLAVDLGDGTDDPRDRAGPAAPPWPLCRRGPGLRAGWRMRANAAHVAGHGERGGKAMMATLRGG